MVVFKCDKKRDKIFINTLNMKIKLILSIAFIAFSFISNAQTKVYYVDLKEANNTGKDF